MNDTGNGGFYSNTSNVESEISYIGVNYARDTFAGHTQLGAMQQINSDIGLLYDIILHSDAPYSNQLSDIRQNYAMIDQIEGPNEVDNWPTLFNGLTGYNASVLMQNVLYRDVKSYPPTAGKPVLSLTLANASNLGSIGNMAASADFANVHSYLQWGGYWGAFTYPSLQWSLNTFGNIAPGKPLILTEGGWWTLPANWGVPENVQAKFILTMIFDDFLLGAKRTYIYQLNDEYPDPQGTDIEKHLGLFNYDGSAKQAATALHNLNTLMSYEVKNFPLSSLAYSIDGLPSATGHQLLLEKGNGHFVIVVWNEIMFWDNVAHREVTANPIPAVLNLGSPAQDIRVFDPLVNTTAMAEQNNVQSMNIQIPDHPILIVVTP